jgi:hypothetical protein
MIEIKRLLLQRPFTGCLSGSFQNGAFISYKIESDF